MTFLIFFEPPITGNHHFSLPFRGNSFTCNFFFQPPEPFPGKNFFSPRAAAAQRPTRRCPPTPSGSPPAPVPVWVHWEEVPRGPCAHPCWRQRFLPCRFPSVKSNTLNENTSFSLLSCFFFGLGVCICFNLSPFWGSGWIFIPPPLLPFGVKFFYFFFFSRDYLPNCQGTPFSPKKNQNCGGFRFSFLPF